MANPVGSVRLLRSNRVVGVLGGMTTLNYVAHEVYPTVFVLYAVYRYGWSTERIGISLGVVGLSYMITMAGLVDPAVKRLGERRTMLVGLGVGAAGFALYGMARRPWMFLVAMAVQAVWGLALPPSQALMTRYVDAGQQGQLQGAISSLRGMAMIVGPAVVLGGVCVGAGEGAAGAGDAVVSGGGAGVGGAGGGGLVGAEGGVRSGAFLDLESAVRERVCGLVGVMVALVSPLVVGQARPHLLQLPALTKTEIVFNYAGDLWVVPREGGKATRLTVGVGLETAPTVSPDGGTVAFSGDYDGNTDVFTIPIGGGVPKRVTYHPAPDVPVMWTPDGRIVFRSNRQSTSGYTQMFAVAPTGGAAKVLPLPMAYAGAMSGDGKMIAYSPLAPAFGFNYTSYVSWGNYHGGRAGTINVTNLADLTTVAIPHEKTSDFSPVWVGGKVYFLSARKGRWGSSAMTLRRKPWWR